MAAAFPIAVRFWYKLPLSGIMELDEIRRHVIIAMFSDDELMRQLVLKGGNALALVHKLGSRESVDIDFSIAEDFNDIKDTRRRVYRVLQERFATVGFVVFDPSFALVPEHPMPGTNPDWGGYRVEFKIIEREKHESLAKDPEAVRRNAHVIGPLQKRIFRIEISKHEYCAGKGTAELDNYTVYVYTPRMIAVEKLRAICQQMPDYPLVRKKRARSKDFYDIHTILQDSDNDWSGDLDLVRNVFEAKGVPLSLISRIAEYREYHRVDWESVKQSVTGELEDFDYYFDSLLERAKSLESLWIE